MAGSTSQPQTTIPSSNGIELPLSITSIQVTGSNNTDFAETNNCPGSLPSTGNCTITVTFTPTAGGTRTAAMTVIDGAANSPQTVTLTGVGQDFSVTNSGSSTATVSPGQTANYKLALTSAGGFAQTVALTCSGAPAQSTCSVPSSVTLNSSTATMVTVSVTTAGTSANLIRPTSLPLAGRPVIWLALCGLPWLTILCTVSAGWRNWRRSLFYGMVFLCLLLLGITWSSCGGNSSGSSRGGTPAGSYNLTVTGTFISGSATLTHSMKLTLVVQ